MIFHLVACQVIRAALQAGQVDPSTISALEMHGTGTSLGDPIEVGAAFAVLQPPAEAAFAAGVLLISQTTCMYLVQAWAICRSFTNSLIMGMYQKRIVCSWPCADDLWPTFLVLSIQIPGCSTVGVCTCNSMYIHFFAKTCNLCSDAQLSSYHHQDVPPACMQRTWTDMLHRFAPNAHYLH